MTKLTPFPHEARRIAVVLQRSALAGSIFVGALLFFGMTLMTTEMPELLLVALGVGAVFGWDLLLPFCGHFLLRDLEARVPGLANATVIWFRHAQPGDYLDLQKLASQVEAGSRGKRK